MIRRAWGFLSDPKNLAALGLLGGAIAFAWKIAEPRWFAPSAASQANAAAANKQAIATPSGVASQPPKPEPTVTQNAKASSGGTAIITGDNATITQTR